MCAGPIVVLHVPEHVFVPIGIRQHLLKMNVGLRKPCLPLNGCHVTVSLSGQFPVFTDLPQLYEFLLILQLFIPLLQVIYNPLSSLQLHGQSVNLSFLLMDYLFQL